jgi:hypothetical protein
MGDYENRWMPAAVALREVSTYFAAALRLNASAARERAITTLFERLASGLLFASPKGLMLPFADEATKIRRWFRLQLIEPSGEKDDFRLDSGPSQNFVTIPHEFWRAFQRGCDEAGADWDAGEFSFENFCDSDGEWSGFARDVHFDSVDIPAAWLKRADALSSNTLECTADGSIAAAADGNFAARAPAVKDGRPPDDDAILVKAGEMRARGIRDGRVIAKEMRGEPGFENVSTVRVRELLKGRYPPGPQKRCES